MARHRFEVRSTWDGYPLRADEFARVDLELGEAIEIRIEAADYGDPAPVSPAGHCMGLWDYEVVELFLAGSGERYLELEFGPHGHFLALRLAGRRQLVASDLSVEFEAVRRGSRWHGRARLSLDCLPPDLAVANAYAIHGQGPSRRYLAWHPVAGSAPDFHRLECFPPLPPASRP